jgi:hypothetical protein
VNFEPIETKVIHSQSKSAWNVVGTVWGGKYKICRVPYVTCGNEITDTKEKSEALAHAMFISHSFNEMRGKKNK